MTALESHNNKNFILKEKEIKIMKKFVCTVCGYVYEGEAAPEECPVCKGTGCFKFKEQTGERDMGC